MGGRSLEGTWGLISYEEITQTEGKEPKTVQYTRDPFNPQNISKTNREDEKWVIVHLEKNQYIVNVYTWNNNKWNPELNTTIEFKFGKLYSGGQEGGKYTLTSNNLTISMKEEDRNYLGEAVIRSVKKVFRKMSELTE